MENRPNPVTLSAEKAARKRSVASSDKLKKRQAIIMLLRDIRA
jgi:hypothetical protein